MKTLHDLSKRLMKHENFKREYLKKKPLMDFINELIALRVERGLSQEDLARLAGVKKNLIARIESGQCNPSYETMFKIVKALGGELIITARVSKSAR